MVLETLVKELSHSNANDLCIIVARNFHGSLKTSDNEKLKAF